LLVAGVEEAKIVEFRKAGEERLCALILATRFAQDFQSVVS
jgi:hypothetical protein